MALNNEENPHYSLWKDTTAGNVINVMLTYNEYAGFLKGNILKYQLRLGKKDDVDKDIAKIDDYRAELERHEKKINPEKYLNDRRSKILDLHNLGSVTLFDLALMTDAQIHELYSKTIGK